MSHIPALLRDLAFILVVAGFVSVLFKKIKQPVILGYLGAGFLLGPYFSFFPSVKDTQSIQVWAELGVIFLLFGLGLEFSFRKLFQVGRSASITASFEVTILFLVGYLLGQLFGWSTMDSLFFGGILCISSTSIIIRAFEEAGLKGQKFISLVFGVLIVEDLVGVLLLMVLASLGVSAALSGTEMLMKVVELSVFLVFSVLAGLFLIPLILKWMSRELNDESIMIFSVGLCLLMVLATSHYGFSTALGAFLMGCILAETNQGKRIEHVVTPLRNFFSAVFFVSIGMMIDLDKILPHVWQIAVVTTVFIIVKSASVAVGSLLSGQSLKTSVYTGMSLTQIGEFSFIIATLGKQLQLTSDFIFPVTVVISTLTTFTTPLMIKSSDGVFQWIAQKLPQTFHDRLERYQFAMQKRASVNGLKLAWNFYGIKIILNTFVVIGICVLSYQFILPMFYQFMGSSSGVAVACATGTLAASSPFLWAILFGTPKNFDGLSTEQLEVLRGLQGGLAVARGMVGLALILLCMSFFTSIQTTSALLLIVVSGGILFGVRWAEPYYRFFELRMLTHLRSTDMKGIFHSPRRRLAPWDAGLFEIVVHPESEIVGKRLLDLRLRETQGTTLAMIERGAKRIIAPESTEVIYPYDHLFFLGTDEQLFSVYQVLEARGAPKTVVAGDERKFGLSSILIKADTDLVGKAIKDCGVREKFSGLIVGIERDGQRFLNPEARFELRAGDLLWIVGELRSIDAYNHAPAG